MFFDADPAVDRSAHCSAIHRLRDTLRSRAWGSVSAASIVTVAVLLLALAGGCGGGDSSSPPVDTTAPSRVTNLAVTAVSDSSITLGWTAPGDDGGTGTAQTYQVRRAGTSISEANWATATTISGAPAPKTAGSAESFVVAGLAAGNVYHFALKALDDAGNASPLSNVASDTTSGGTPPVRPVLAVTPGSLDFGDTQTTLSLTITNAGTGTLGWSIESNRAWLVVQPSIGSTTTEADIVTVTVFRGGLPAGEYTGTLTITPNPGEPRTIPVTMTVSAPPALVLSTQALDFGTAGSTMTFAIENGGSGALEWTITDDHRGWASVTPATGTTTTETDEVTVSVSRAGLSPGAWTAELTVTPSFGTAQTIVLQMGVVDDGVRFITIQPGSFTMGSPADEPGRDDDETQREVTLTHEIQVGVAEVTQADWQAVMGWNESGFPGPTLPVEEITWLDAVAYCNARSEREGRTPAYTLSGATYEGNHITFANVTWNPSADGYRLPTEAEWEYVCRAGTETALCNGGISHLACIPPDPNLDLVGWYCGNAFGSTREPGGKGANAWGLVDMHGNLAEWCWDWYANYPAGPETDPTGPATGTHRVRRGGGWNADAEQCRSANRGWNVGPGGRANDTGLRVVRGVR